MGMAKGIRTVYMILVIPNHVAINKLASASGIRMVANGLVLLCLGPVVGKLKYSELCVPLSDSFVHRLDSRLLGELCYLYCVYELYHNDLYHNVDYRNIVF